MYHHRQSHKNTTICAYITRKILHVSVLVTAMVGIGFAATASSVSLKYNSVIEGDVITLGDLFSGLDKKADRVLGPAPRPGKDMTLNARTLMRVAIAMDLPWRPASSAEFVTLSRAATVVTPNIIEDALKEELGHQGVNGKFGLNILSGLHDIILPQSAAKSVEITSLTFNGSQNRFQATLVAPSSNNPIVRENITGTIERLISVPVLKNTIKNGDVITSSDLSNIDLRSSAVHSGMILNVDDLVGLTPRRILHAGKPIKDSMVEYPQIVQRGELVTMVFNNGLLSLTAQGKALENGAKGDVIRVVNANSSKTLEARITGQKEVAVQSF